MADQDQRDTRAVRRGLRGGLQVAVTFLTELRQTIVAVILMAMVLGLVEDHLVELLLPLLGPLLL